MGWYVWGAFSGLFIFLLLVIGVLIFWEVATTGDISAAHWIRKIGTSALATSISWALIVGFTFGAFWGLVVFFVHALIVTGLVFLWAVLSD